MKQIFSTLFFLLFTSGLLFAQPNTLLNNKSPQYLPGVVIVKFKENSKFTITDKKSKIELMKSSFESSVISAVTPFSKLIEPTKDLFGVRRITEVRFSSTIDAYTLAQEISKNPDVEYAEPMYERKLCEFVPDDPDYSQQWYSKAIGLENAWAITQGSPEIIIAIVDNGVFMDHEDLKANIWSNPNEIPDNGIDDDKNGYIDDVHGWDFVGNWSGGDFIQDNNPQPLNSQIYHGTHAAGCAAAIGNNGIGIAGSAWQCKILPIKVASDNIDYNVIYNGYEGILYAAKMGADIINCSWAGQSYSQTEQDVVNQAVAMGSIVIAAAGNYGRDLAYFNQYPAKLDNVISTGASTQNEGVAGFSNYGWDNCVYAPGVGIYSTMPGDLYSAYYGTSKASPILAGIAALVKSIHPNWKYKQMYHQLRSTSDDALSKGDEARRLIFYGRVNAFKAVSYNSQFSNNTIPGISLLNYSIGDKKEISESGTFKSSFSFKNYLAASGLITLILKPFDDFITLSKDTFEIINFDSTKNQILEINLTVAPTIPWFNGTAKILVKYDSKSYVDYEVIEVPIKIKSANKFTELVNLPIETYPLWAEAYSPSKYVFWAVGYAQSSGKGVYSKFGSDTLFIETQKNELLITVFAFDDLNAFIGSNQNNGITEIMRTSDGGNNFERIDVSTITPFINNIHFFDKKYGLLLGNQINDKFGIGYTTDGGTSWKKISQQPLTQAGENGFQSAVSTLKNNIWFGTDRGRILYSNDKGQAWHGATVEDGKRISKIAFSTENKGLALYGDLYVDATKIASTIDGGKTWEKNVMDFENVGQLPLNIFSAEDSEDIFVVTKEGRIYRTSDLGKTWSTILASAVAPLKTSATFCQEERGRLWMVNDNVSCLDFAYGNPNPQLTLISSNPINFNMIEVGKEDIQTAILQNTGNTIIEFDSVYIDNNPDKEFTNVSEKPSDLDLNAKSSISIKFNPVSKGTKTATLVIKTNAQNLSIPLSGEAYEAGSVKELENLGFHILSLNPNPADGFINFNYITDNEVNLNVQLFDINGSLINSFYHGMTTIGAGKIQINTTELTVGTYYLGLSIDDKIAILKFIIKR